MPAGISNGGNVIFVEYTLVFSKMDSLPGEVQRIERIGYENEKNDEPVYKILYSEWFFHSCPVDHSTPAVVLQQYEQ